VPRSFASDRTWEFDVEPSRLWGRLTAVDEYRSWWPWLRAFRSDEGFTDQSCWECEVAPPLPYTVRFTVLLEEVEAPRHVRASVGGDLTGEAELSLRSEAGGRSTVRLRSCLTPTDPLLRRVARLAPPMVRWGHDWVLEQGRRQFVDRAADGPSDPRGPGAPRDAPGR
jgi:hypothetical protein